MTTKRREAAIKTGGPEKTSAKRDLSESLRKDLIRNLDKAEAEADSVALKLAGEHADWVLNGLLSGEEPNPDALRWYRSLSNPEVEAILSLGGYTARIRLVRSHLLKGELGDALLLSMTVIAHPRVVVDRRGALLAQERRLKGAHARSRAVAIVEAGIDLARELTTRGNHLTARSLFDAFGGYTMEEPLMQSVEDATYEVWRDGECLYEQRRFPPGLPKQVSFELFTKKSYYYSEIRKIAHLS